MSMAVINWLKLAHLLTVMMAVGGALAQFILITKSRQSGAEAAANEKMALAVFRALAFPGLLLAFVLGLSLAGVSGKFSEPWIHVKMTAVFIWLILAHMESSGLKKMVSQRAASNSNAVGKIKSRHLMIGKINIILILAIVYLAVFRLDAF